MVSYSLVYFQIGVTPEMFSWLTVGDIPLAFVMTLATSQPFTPQDQSLGVAYISVILVWCFLTMFPFGGWMLVKRDFDRPLVRNDIEERAQGTGVNWLTRVKQIAKRTATSKVSCINRDRSSSSSTVGDCVVVEDKDTKNPPRDSVISALEVQRPTTSSSVCEMEVIQPVRSHHSHHTAQTHDETELQDLSLAATPSLSRHRNLTTPTPLEPLYKRIAKSVFKFLLSLISPPAISCLLSLLIALIPTLKALFVANVPGVNMPDGPDGMPPLEWILDITTFGGTRPSTVSRYLL